MLRIKNHRETILSHIRYTSLPIMNVNALYQVSRDGISIIAYVIGLRDRGITFLSDASDYGLIMR